MAKSFFKDGSLVGDYNKPYIVAEVNSSHNGNVDMAKRIIDEIKNVGCDCAKFQSWSKDSLYSDQYYKENPITKRIVSRFSLTQDELLDLANYCKKIGLAFASTPYSKQEVDWLLEKCKVPYIKVASMDINNYPFLEYIGKTGAPVMLSTGMSSMKEIHQAIACIENTGNRNLSLLHCVSLYPTEEKYVNLQNIVGLRKEFPKYPIGFSDHTMGHEISCAATALGAAIIEKHFTLDNSKMGMDNNMAIEPDEMKKVVVCCQKVYCAMGTEERTVSAKEFEQSKKMRRSAVTTRLLQSDEILTEQDITFKRPGDGITPKELEKLIGKKLNKDIPYGMKIAESDFQE